MGNPIITLKSELSIDFQFSKINDLQLDSIPVRKLLIVLPCRLYGLMTSGFRP